MALAGSLRLPPGWRFVMRRLIRRNGANGGGGGGRCFATARCSVVVSQQQHQQQDRQGSSEMCFETGHLARFADGSVVVTQGDNAILATAVTEADCSSSSSSSSSASAASPASFLPLIVDFKQSASALGRIPTNYLRRELQQSDADILTSRIIDRSIRPLFPKEFTSETQVICKPLSLDETGDTVVLGVNAASAALALSKIPWNGPVGAVRVALIDNKIVVNPARTELKQSQLNMILSGCSNGEHILMIDMDGCQITAQQLNECVEVGLEAIARITKTIQQLANEAGKPKLELGEPESDELLLLEDEIRKLSNERLYYILSDISHDKISRDEAISALRDEMIISFPDESPSIVSSLFSTLTKKTLREMVLESNIRCDGRGLKDFRPINIEVDLYRKLHGSALFQRGQTQVLGTVTFDAPSAAFHPDSISQLLGAQRRKMFMLHYEFPPYAVNEISSSKRRMNRRELGHGALAEKALQHLIPDNFPYSVRLACEVLESNGSSSMASVCVGTLALLDAGVPLKASAAGVAIGLITSDDGKEYRLLTDILGIEDYAGDMDFKVAGTCNGLTAIQLDLKIPGISRQLLNEAITRGQEGLAHVLSLMQSAQKAPRAQFKDSVPVIENISLPIFRRHILFRSGAYNAKLVEAETGVKISIEDDAHISLTAPNKASLEEAKQMMEKIFADESGVELNFGALYKAEIVEVLENGVMVTLKKGMKPMFLKNSNLDTRRVAHASALGLEVGSVITVQYLGRDTATGHHRISRKTLQSTTLPLQNLLLNRKPS